MKKTIFAAVAATAMVVGTATSAATLSLTGTGFVDYELGSNFSFGSSGVGPGDTIKYLDGASKNSSNGLELSGPANLTYTFLGSEAGFSNYAARVGGSGNLFLGNGFAVGSTIGDSETVFQSTQNLIDLLFQTVRDGTTSDDRIANQGGAQPEDSKIKIGYFGISDTRYILMFDDLTNNPDLDFDDFVVGVSVNPVPVPASSLLLLAGLGGLAVMKRRSRS